MAKLKVFFLLVCLATSISVSAQLEARGYDLNLSINPGSVYLDEDGLMPRVELEAGLTLGHHFVTTLTFGAEHGRPNYVQFGGLAQHSAIGADMGLVYYPLTMGLDRTYRLGIGAGFGWNQEDRVNVALNSHLEPELHFDLERVNGPVVNFVIDQTFRLSPFLYSGLKLNYRIFDSDIRFVSVLKLGYRFDLGAR